MTASLISNLLVFCICAAACIYIVSITTLDSEATYGQSQVGPFTIHCTYLYLYLCLYFYLYLYLYLHLYLYLYHKQLVVRVKLVPLVSCAQPSAVFCIISTSNIAMQCRNQCHVYALQSIMLCMAILKLQCNPAHCYA